ncbi:EboA domain-containing protein [Cellulomonas carbonis]|uniref:Sugar phosphate isomerase n=1 Tax=Cellulomonas carbonis T26 TaxID=947969 RepID=A0A0A0BR49_9CELL|nr:EboA domain-containing protein [Cellulomonas carbonis]KGM10446.1 sugar phosphate isomerase [Cellulomonas carbonis T26]GGC13484.1 hypothetical protein GCM10010972_28460 [Cellulomonas carbonis]
MTPADARSLTAARDLLAPDQLARLDVLVTQVEHEPSSVHRVLPAVARTVGRGPVPDADGSAAVGAQRVEDVARVEVLRALPHDDAAVAAATVAELYEHGDADERRAVLLALPHLAVGDLALPLVRDALRTNDVRLVAAAMGPYAAAHLEDEAWRHGVLKCLFTGVPLAVVAGLTERTDAELVRMVRAYAAERTAAGRAVPDDVRLVTPDHIQDGVEG